MSLLDDSGIAGPPNIENQLAEGDDDQGLLNDHSSLKRVDDGDGDDDASGSPSGDQIDNPTEAGECEGVDGDEAAVPNRKKRQQLKMQAAKSAKSSKQASGPSSVKQAYNSGADEDAPSDIVKTRKTKPAKSELPWEHKKQPPIMEAADVSYCPTCGLPVDFCDFGLNWEACRPTALRKYAKFYEHYIAQNGGVVAEDTGTSELKEPPKQSNKKKKATVAATVTIQRVSRAKHKMATVVCGLDLFGVKLDSAARLFKKQFACGSSAVKGLPGQQDHVEIQGDFEDMLPDLILANFADVPEDSIVHLKPK